MSDASKMDAATPEAAFPSDSTDRRLYFVRHGETDWNVAGRLQGRRDVPLNSLGRIQATQVGRVLNQLVTQTDALAYVSSPLSRAVETMRILRTTLDLRVSDFQNDTRFSEISFGQWEGQTWPELRRRDRDGVRKRDLDPWRFTPPGGESYVHLCTRVGTALNEISGDAVVVTHGGVIRAALHVLTGMPPEEAALLPVRQGAIYVVAGGSFKVAD